MKIQSTRPALAARQSQQQSESKASLSSRIQDTFHRGYVDTMMCLPGALPGGLVGGGIGFMNGLTLAPFLGLKPALVSAGVFASIGALAGGALSYSLAQID